MAQGQAQHGGPVAADPAAIRAGMAETRRELGRKLGALKRGLRNELSTSRGKKTMTQKKGKTTSAKASRAKNSGGGARTAAKRAKKVLKDVLTGAAAGAVRGAAEAAMPGTGKAGEAGRKSKKSGE